MTPNSHVLNSMMRAFGAQGKIEEMTSLFSKLSVRALDTDNWTHAHSRALNML